VTGVHDYHSDNLASADSITIGDGSTTTTVTLSGEQVTQFAAHSNFTVNTASVTAYLDGSTDTTTASINGVTATDYTGYTFHDAAGSLTGFTLAGGHTDFLNATDVTGKTIDTNGSSANLIIDDFLASTDISHITTGANHVQLTIDVNSGGAVDLTSKDLSSVTSLITDLGSSVSITDTQAHSLSSIVQLDDSSLTIEVSDVAQGTLALPTHAAADTVAFTLASASSSHDTEFTGLTTNDYIDVTAVVTNSSGVHTGVVSVGNSGISGLTGTATSGASIASANAFVMQGTVTDVTNEAQVGNLIGSISGINSSTQSAVFFVSNTTSTSANAQNTTAVWLFTASHASGGVESLTSGANSGDLHLLGTTNTVVFSNDIILHH
jgi:hypothetical protein